MPRTVVVTAVVTCDGVPTTVSVSIPVTGPSAPAFGSYDPSPATTGPNGAYSAVPLSAPMNTTFANQHVVLGQTQGFTTPGTYTGYLFGRVSCGANGFTLQSCTAQGVAGETLTTDTFLFDNDGAGGFSWVLQDCAGVVKAGNESLYLNCFGGHDTVTRRCYGFGGCDIADIRNSHNGGGPVNWTDYGSYFGQYTGFLVDPEHSNGPSHNDCAQIFGGSNVHFYGTHFDGFVNTTLGDGAKWAGAANFSSSGGLQGNSAVQTNVITGALSGVGFHDVFVHGGNISMNFDNADAGPYQGTVTRIDELSGTFGRDMNSADSIITKGPIGTATIYAAPPAVHYADGTPVTIHTN